MTAIASGGRAGGDQAPGKAGPEVKLGKPKVGDRLLATCAEAVGIKLRKA